MAENAQGLHSPLKVLLVEDSLTDAKLILRCLEETFSPIDSLRVADAGALREALSAKAWDIVVSDWSLPSFSGSAALAIVGEVAPAVPFIVVSGTVGEEVAVAAMRAGARDYVLKDMLTRLPAAITREVREARAHASEQRRRAEDGRFVDVTLELLCVANFDGRFLRVNPAWERTLGWSNEELMATRALDLIHPEDRAATAASGAEFLRTGTLKDFENRYRCKDGSYRTMLWSGIAFPAERLAYMAARDITVRRSAEEQLRSSERRYRVLFDSSPLPKWLYDLKTLEFLEVNEAAVRNYGYSRAEFLRMTIKDIRPPEDVAAVVEHTSRIRPGVRDYGHWRHRRKDGSVIDVEVSGQSFDIEGRTCRLVVLNDVTERNRIERELRERAGLMALTAEVGLALTEAESLRAMLQISCDALVKQLGAAFARIWTLQASGRHDLELQASAGLTLEGRADKPRVPGAAAQIAEARRPHASNDAQHDALVGEQAWTQREKLVGFAGYPLLIEGGLVGVIELFSRSPLSGATLAALDAIAQALAVGVSRRTAESARSTLEAQLRQAQRIEAIGRLTGGIAHDFNNMLSVILARAAFLLEELSPGDPRREDAAEIRVAAERAAGLTRQLLAFSRKQVLELRVVNLNLIMAGLEKMLRRLLGEDIELSIDPAPDLGSVRADAGQLEQVLMNLAVNARDAMPDGGKLSLQTANVVIDEAYATQHPSLPPGAYALLIVSDTGTGMSAEVQQHLFEPFFTTKEQGKGTGLGLSTSHGIVKQSGGHIWVYSEPGHGTVFRIYLPIVDGAPEPAEVRSGGAQQRGTETVLLVDDDDHVRSAAERILASRGYAVLPARSGPDALAKAAQHAGPIDVVVSDVVMPGESGPEFVQRLRKVRPGIAVLFMSGFTDHAVVEKASSEGANYLQKPFTLESLADRVRSILDHR